MPRTSVAFLILAVVAAVLGFTGPAENASSMAWILFVVLLVPFFANLVTGRRVSA